MLLLRPTGRFSVGVQDVSYCTADSTSSIAADNHVVGRLYYPAKPAGLLTCPLTWIRNYKYAQGYVSWGLRNPSTFKEKLLKTTASNLIYTLGSTRLLSGSYNAAPEDRHGKFPVIIFSHGAASMRNTYSIICSEFASRGFVVAAVEHADGTACCAQLANGEWHMLQGLGSGPTLAAKCEYRVQECMTMAQALQAMNTGSTIQGLSLSGPEPAAAAFQSVLDMSRLAIMGHSCGGATAAAAVAQHAEFKCGVALDPWWPLLPSSSAALNGWQTSSPLLVLGSQDWNTPGKMWCDAARQERVFKACLPQQPTSSTRSSSSSSSISRPSAALPVVATASSGNNGNSSSSSTAVPLGGGAVHIVPAGSSHGSFTDLPFLLSDWLANLLRKAVSGKSAPPSSVPSSVIQDAIIWASHTFLQDHLPLAADCPASLAHQQRWEARLQDSKQEQQRLGGGSSSGSSGGDGSATATSGAEAAVGNETAARVAASAFAKAAEAAFGDTSDRSPAGSSSSRREKFDRRDSIVDHLAADETLIVADEATGHQPDAAAAAAADSGSAAAAVGGGHLPQAHSAQHASALEQAASVELAAAAQQQHLPVRKSEEVVYKEKLGEAAYLIAVHTC